MEIVIKSPEQRCAELLENSGLPDATIDEIVKAIDYIETGGPLVTKVASLISRARLAQRVKAAEAAKQPTNGVEERLHLLRAHGWNAVEIEHIRMMFTPGETLQEVGFHVIRTTKRTISRDEVDAYGRPASWSNDVTWARQFPAASAIRALEADVAERENPNPARNINQDFAATGGVRPGR